MTCVWEADPACLGTEWETLSDDVKSRSLMLATSSLLALTNNRVGTCPITIRPCPPVKPCGCVWQPYMGEGGVWYNGCPCGSQCAPLSEIDVPGPVGYIDLFLINGVPVDLASGDWRMDNGHLLVWQGLGPSPVPSIQNLNLPDTEPGTWSITYSKSYPVQADAKIAVAYLAMEFAKACRSKKCALPRGVTSVVRSGVSFTIEAGLFPGGLTGLEMVDQFILKWVPPGSPSRTAVVFDPRRMPPRRTSAVPLRAPSGSV